MSQIFLKVIFRDFGDNLIFLNFALSNETMNIIMDLCCLHQIVYESIAIHKVAENLSL